MIKLKMQEIIALPRWAFGGMGSKKTQKIYDVYKQQHLSHVNNKNFTKTYFQSFL